MPIIGHILEPFAQKRQFFFRGHTKFLWAHIPLFMGKYPKRPLLLVLLEFGLRFLYIMMNICTYLGVISAISPNFLFAVTPYFYVAIYSLSSL